MGDADVVPGARPDVEAVYPTYPQNYRAGWGYLLLTNMLPHIPTQQMFGGQGTISIYAFATDMEGHRAAARAITDGPDPDDDHDGERHGGETVRRDRHARAGTDRQRTAVNFGWALTPDSDTVAGNGDIVVPDVGLDNVVLIDGAPVSTVMYNLCRGNVGSPRAGRAVTATMTWRTSSARPSRSRSSHREVQTPRSTGTWMRARGPIGAYVFDTTALSNGRHSIVWSVTDSAGRVDGIGSRDFIVFNGSSGSLVALQDAPAQTSSALLPTWRRCPSTGLRCGVALPSMCARHGKRSSRTRSAAATCAFRNWGGSSCTLVQGQGPGTWWRTARCVRLPPGSQLRDGRFHVGSKHGLYRDLQPGVPERWPPGAGDGEDPPSERAIACRGVH